MKRPIVVFILCAALLLSGCGAVRVAEESPSPAPAPVPTAAAAPSPAPTPDHPAEQFPFAYEEVLADTEDFFLAVTALGVDWENNWVVHLRLENRTDQIMNVRFLYQSINGLAIDDVFVYRLAVGAVQEPSFRILREELSAWGEPEPVQWGFTLRVSSAESNREPYFYEELSASPFGQQRAQRYEYRPSPQDHVVMDNAYATVYVTGWQVEEEGLCIDYVAVNHCGRPLLLVLPDGAVLLDGQRHAASLGDSFGAYATLFGYLPVPDHRGEDAPQSIELRLALADPAAQDTPLLDDSESYFVLYGR